MTALLGELGSVRGRDARCDATLLEPMRGSCMRLRSQTRRRAASPIWQVRRAAHLAHGAAARAGGAARAAAARARARRPDGPGVAGGCAAGGRAARDRRGLLRRPAARAKGARRLELRRHVLGLWHARGGAAAARPAAPCASLTVRITSHSIMYAQSWRERGLPNMRMYTNCTWARPKSEETRGALGRHLRATHGSAGWVDPRVPRGAGQVIGRSTSGARVARGGFDGVLFFAHSAVHAMPLNYRRILVYT